MTCGRFAPGSVIDDTPTITEPGAQRLYIPPSIRRFGQALHNLANSRAAVRDRSTQFPVAIITIILLNDMRSLRSGSVMLRSFRTTNTTIQQMTYEK